MSMTTTNISATRNDQSVNVYLPDGSAVCLRILRDINYGGGPWFELEAVSKEGKQWQTKATGKVNASRLSRSAPADAVI